MTDERAPKLRTDPPLRALLEQAPSFVTLVDENHRIQFINHVVPGLDIADVIGRPVYDFIQPEDHEIARERIEHVLRTGEASSYASQARGPHGTVAWYENYLGPVLQDGSVRAVSLIGTDVTQQKRAQAELRESHELFRASFEHANVAMLLTDLDGRLRMVNRAACEMLGYSKEELEGTPFRALTHPDDVSRNLDQLQKLQSGEIDTLADEKRYVRKDGEVVWVRLSVATVKNADGEPQHLITHAADITERKRTEAALLEQKDLAETLIANAQTIILLLDTQGRIARFNPYFETVSGYRFDEVLGRDWFTTFLPEGDRDRIREVFKRTVANIHTSGNVNPIVVKDGSLREIEWYNDTLKDNQGKVLGVLAVGVDVTERRLADEERSRLQEQLHQTQKMEAIGTLAGGVAHDMNNILGGILMFADLLEPSDLGGSDAPETVQQITGLCKRGRELTRRLLGFARKGPHQKVAVDMSELAREVAGILRGTGPKDLSIDLDLDEEPASVEGDPGQLNSVLMNLCLNAVDATAGSGTLTITCGRCLLETEQITTRPDLPPGPYVRVQVKDSGAGMDEDALRRAAEPFYTTKAPGAGTGLGLSMAYGAVESHGGCLTIDSAVGKGTTVAVYLPETGGASPHRTPAPQRRESVDAGHAGTALIVDDERSIRLATGKLLKRFGYEVQVARDGQEALQACRERGGHFSVVILDLVMPNMSGAETFHALRREFPELKILLASGYSNEESADELLAAGAAGFVQKPFSLQDLLNALESALG